MRIRQSLPQPYIPRTGTQISGRCSGWELVFRDCGATPGWRLLLTGGTGWGDVREEIVVGKACGGKPGSRGSKAILLSHARGWSHHHSLSLPTWQHWRLNNREAGPSNASCTELQSRTPTRVPLSVPDAPIYRERPQSGGPLYVPDVLNNREGPQAREPSKCLNWQSYGERLTKEAFWSPATRDLKKDSNRAITPSAEAVHIPAQLVLPGSPQAKQLCHLHAQLSLGQNCHGQKNPCAYARRLTLVMSNSLQPCRLWPARLLCQGGGFSRQEPPNLKKRERLWLFTGASRNYSEQREFSSLWHL